jgi:hypothetical protein
MMMHMHFPYIDWLLVRLQGLSMLDCLLSIWQEWRAYTAVPQVQPIPVC